MSRQEQPYGLEEAAQLWEEYRYRHDLIWSLLFRMTAAVTLLSIAPYTIDDVAREGAGDWVVVLPLLGALLALGGWVLLRFEMKLFGPINSAYQKAKTDALGVVDHVKKRFDLFKVVIFAYPLALVTLALLVHYIYRYHPDLALLGAVLNS